MKKIDNWLAESPNLSYKRYLQHLIRKGKEIVSILIGKKTGFHSSLTKDRLKLMILLCSKSATDDSILSLNDIQTF